MIEDIKIEQPNCSECLQIRGHLAEGREKVQKKFEVVDDVLYRTLDEERLPVVPLELRDRVIEEHHDSPLYGHAGRDATVGHIQKRYYWPNLQRDVGKYIDSCLICKKAKSTPPRRFGLIQQSNRGGDCQALSIDLFGPLPGGGYLLVMLDPFSHFLVLSRIDTKEASSVVDAFVKDILLKGYLPRRLIISDNGSEFNNAMFDAFVKQLRKTYGLDGQQHDDYLKHIFVAVHSPQQNPVERVNRFIKAMLKTMVNQAKNSTVDWAEFVPYVEYVYNRMKIPGTQISPFMLRHGRDPLEPRDWARVANIPIPNRLMSEHIDKWYEQFRQFEELVAKAHLKAQGQQLVQYNKNKFDVEYEVGEQVLAWLPKTKNKLYFTWRRPYEIIEKMNPAVYKIRELGNPSARDRNESIRNLVRVRETRPVNFRVPPSTKETLQKGKMIVFRTPILKGRWKKNIYVGEIYTDREDEDDEWISVHFYSDLRPDDSWKNVDPTSRLNTRKVSPEWKTPNGVSFTDKNKKTARSEPVVNDYLPHEIEILAANFDLYSGQVPSKIIKKVYQEIEKRDRPHGSIQKTGRS
mmetsp:Transcript_19126/g.61523  ORF Transcript_19126/g.61523 Transcript_19126/m.61523 type:complete len:576 (+) Transcript_19126:1815-3542(+)